MLKINETLTRDPQKVWQTLKNFDYPNIFIVTRHITVIPSQQLNPSASGFPPFLISFTILVFNPIAAIARIIKNLLTSLNGANTDVGTPSKFVAIVVINDASTK